MTDVSGVISSIAALLWPVAFIVLIWLVGPTLREVLSRLRGGAFTLDVGGVKVSFEDATDQQRKLIGDLQEKVIELEARITSQPLGVAEGRTAYHSPRTSPSRVLWVDDYPANNAQLAAVLRERNIAVVLATNTSEALHRARAGDIDAVITDMGRHEDGESVPDAGVRLVRLLRDEDKTLPIYVYCSHRGVIAHRDAALNAGANAVTSSSMELLSHLGV
jgi:CheY-like chemotaxis protein